ncbi:MAG TPA: hypothetical protein VFH48_06410 [Chloroflexota bacterium]|nr:hypothetical protein [Chloroflexota bacterium]
MDPDRVAAQVRERSGLDVQAVTLVRSGASDELVPWVWAAMTEHGHFWAVEDGETLELFRAVARRTSPDDLLACHSAVEAARRFLLLHPKAVESPALVQRQAGSAAAHGAADVIDEAGLACQVCGATYTRRRQAAQAGSARSLCPRCRHAERERLRYQQDPRYRARRLAYSAARYRQSQQAAGQE